MGRGTVAGGQLPRAERARIDAAYNAEKAQSAQHARQREAARLAARPGADERPAAVHCLVYGSDTDPGPFPGIVTAWRRLPWGGRQARVTYALPRPDADTLVVQQWLTDEQVSPLGR